MKFIELFAGIGGFRLGLEQAGHECVYVNEWEDKPASIYERVFNEKPDTRDIRLISGRELPEADLIVGGFPCATFSVAGKKSGFCLSDARGSLCFEMFRIASERGIPYILFENVKGLLNHDSGKTFAVILCALDELGYDCQWELLDSQNFGVPQHRERIFLVGHLRGKPRPKVFPVSIPSGADGSTSEAERRRRERLQSEVCGTLDANYHKGGSSRTFVKMSMLSHTMSNMKQRTQDRHSTWTMDTAPQNKMVVHDHSGVRKLTPLECERLQGLPDNHTKYFADGSLVSDSQRYERCGRTVTVPVIEAIGRGLNEFF